MTNYSWAENTLGTFVESKKNNGKYSKNRETVIRQPPDFFEEILLDYTFFVQFFDCECLL